MQKNEPRREILNPIYNPQPDDPGKRFTVAYPSMIVSIQSLWQRLFFCARSTLSACLLIAFCIEHAAGGEPGAVRDIAISNFTVDTARILSDFDAFAVTPGNRLHVWADDGFDLDKPAEKKRARAKADAFLSRVLRASNTDISPYDRNDTADFLADMGRFNGLSKNIEIRPNQEKRVETLCRIGLANRVSDPLMLNEMFDDPAKTSKMQALGRKLGISKEAVQEYFLVHELAHCLTDRSSFGLSKKQDGNLSPEAEDLNTLRREMCADGLAALYWIRQGYDRKLFDFVVGTRKQEAIEYMAADHMTIPVIRAVYGQYATPAGRSRLRSMSAQEILDLTVSLAKMSLPTLGDIYRLLEALSPGHYAATHKAGKLSAKRMREVQAAISTVPDNKFFINAVLAE